MRNESLIEMLTIFPPRGEAEQPLPDISCITLIVSPVLLLRRFGVVCDICKEESLTENSQWRHYEQIHFSVCCHYVAIIPLARRRVRVGSH